MSATLGHAMRRKRVELDAKGHSKRAVAYGRAADRFGDRSVALFAEMQRLQELEKLCRERAKAHTWAALVFPKETPLKKLYYAKKRKQL